MIGPEAFENLATEATEWIAREVEEPHDIDTTAVRDFADRYGLMRERMVPLLGDTSVAEISADSWIAGMAAGFVLARKAVPS